MTNRDAYKEIRDVVVSKIETLEIPIGTTLTLLEVTHLLARISARQAEGYRAVKCVLQFEKEVRP